MGGQSSCPGETGTTKIDSGVTIAALEYHCGDDFAPQGDCADLEVGRIATIGIILQNISPSQRAVLYRLDVQQSSPWDAGKYYYDDYCGTPGDSGGLKFLINGVKPSAYMLDGLPYGQSEVLLTVEKTHPHCLDFKDISITLTSQCEYAADDVYQYRTTLSDTLRKVGVVHPVWNNFTADWGLQPDGETTTAAHGPDASSATFSVSWVAQSPETLAISIDLAARVPANATASEYCSELESSGVDDVQAAVVSSYVTANFDFEALSADASCLAGDGTVDVTFVLQVYAADVFDRSTGETAESFAAKLSEIVSEAVASGKWVDDQLALEEARDGRRLETSQAKDLILKEQFSGNAFVSSSGTLSPTIAPNAATAAPTPRDDDGGALAGVDAKVLLLVVIFLQVFFALLAPALARRLRENSKKPPLRPDAHAHAHGPNRGVQSDQDHDDGDHEMSALSPRPPPSNRPPQKHAHARDAVAALA
ncbi:hypothetical protein M885DRAFT_78635 [Pelagophyceae sp. CCMP2097]|nr:hypothetical protein M885DRAFT_78635 [Pelagophyceae sp. CCMP2097]